MVELAQVWWILFDVLNHFQSAFSHGPFFWAFLLEVGVPLRYEREVVEFVTDSFKADDGRNECKVGDCNVIGYNEFLVYSFQVFFEHTQGRLNTFITAFIARILKTCESYVAEQEEAIVSVSFYLEEDWRQCVWSDCAVEVSHVVAQPMIDECPQFGIFRISLSVWRISITEILHYRDVLR